MNWEYSLGAIAVILIISYGTLVILKKRGKADQANKVNLFFSTVIAIGFALLIPIFAKMLSGSFNTTALTAIILALIIGILMGIGVGVLTMLRRKQSPDASTKAQDDGGVQGEGIEEVQIQLEDLQESDEDLAIGFEEDQSVTGETLVEAAASEVSEDMNSEVLEAKAAASGVPEELVSELGESEAAASEEPEYMNTESYQVEVAAIEDSEQLDEQVLEVIQSEETQAENEWDAALFAGEQRDSALEKIVDTERITDRIGIEEDSAAHNDVAWPEAQIIAKLAEAEEHKAGGRLSESIACLYEVLTQKPDKKLSTLIIIEICSLSKKMDNAQYVRELLESDAVSPLDATIKEEILSNI